MQKNLIYIFVGVILGLIVGFIIRGNNLFSSKVNNSDYIDNYNSQLLYGNTTGAPKNCRAIVKSNIDGYRNNEYSCEDIILSLDRNCGENGYARDPY